MKVREGFFLLINKPIQGRFLMSNKDYIVNELGERFNFNQFTIEDIDDSILDYLPENFEDEESEEEELVLQLN